MGIGCVVRALHFQSYFALKRVHQEKEISSASNMDTSTANDHQPANIAALKRLLKRILRVTVLDGRIFLGTFVGTDHLLNILLANTEEFKIGPSENPNGRYVGQVMIPWRLVVKAEAKGPAQGRRNALKDSDVI